MYPVRRATIKVSDETHRSIKLLAAALRIRQADVVDRAVGHYRMRHARAIAELSRRRDSEDVSDLPYGERIDLLRDVIKEKAGGTVWVVQDTGLICLAIDPPHEDPMGLTFELEDLLRAQVSVMSRQQVNERRIDLTAPPCRRL